MCCHERVNDIRDLTKYRLVFYVAVYFGGIIKVLDCGALHDVGNRLAPLCSHVNLTFILTEQRNLS